MTFIKIVLFGLSTLGSFQLIRKISNDKISIYFLPSLTIALQVTILFFAGIFNLLPEASIMLFILGIIGLGIALWDNKGADFLKTYFNDGYILLLLIMIVMGLSVRGKIFSHYDNFSHWAIVVRNMLEVNHYPNFESSLIMFQEYPLGSATYIYYFAKMISSSESTQMLAQIYMILAALLPLFSLVKKRSIKIDLIFLVLVNFVFVYNITVRNLLVDTLLPVVGICAFLFARIHCKDNAEKKHFWFLSCYLVQLIQIKNSGIFFVVTILIVGFKYLWEKGSRFNNVLSALFPFASLLIWQKHCKYVFSSAATSKHAMTVENYQSVFGDKSAEDIRAICTKLLKLSITFKDVWVLLGIAVLLGIVILSFSKGNMRDYKNLLAFSFILYVCYQLGMFGMYIFSMPGGEATALAGSERYLKTILLAILLIFMAFAIRIASHNTINKIGSCVLSVAVIVSLFVFAYVSQGKIQFAPLTEYSNEERKWLEERIWIENNKEMYSIPMHDSYCVLIPSYDSEYTYYLLKYIFQSNDVSSKIVENTDDLYSISSKYILVYDQENEIINSWISETYPEQIGNEVIIR